MNETYMRDLQLHMELLRKSAGKAIRGLKQTNGGLHRAVLTARLYEAQGALDRLQDEIEGYHAVEGLMSDTFNSDYYSFEV